MTPTVTGLLTVGTNFRIVNGLAGPLNAPVFVVNNNPRFTFAGVPTTTGDVNILLTSVVPLAAVVNPPAAAPAVVAVAAPAAVAVAVAVAVAAAPLLDVPAAPGSNLQAVQNAIATLTSPAAIINVLNQLAPASQNLAAPWVAAQATSQFNDILTARVEEIQNLCCDDCGPNRAQVNTQKCIGPNNRSNWWAKGYSKDGSQGDVNGLFGYKTDAKGLIVAYDTPLNDQTRAGLGVHYSKSAIDGNYSSGRVNIDSYQLMGYLSHAPGPWFVQGMLVAGKDNYDSSRNIVLPGLSQAATASYGGNQYTGLVRAGVVAYSQRFTVTPFVSLQYSRIAVDGHTEQGAAGIDLRVENQKYNFLQSGLGVKAETIVKSRHGAYAPEVHFKWLHDFKATTMQETAAFAAGGAQFLTPGVTQSREMFNVGAGVTLLTCNCDKKAWTLKGVYDFKWNSSNYSAHQVSLVASLKW